MDRLKHELFSTTQFPHVFRQDIVPILSSILSDLCETNDKRNLQYITKFHAASRPPISLFDYLERVYRYADCSETCFILALIFIDRIQVRPEFTVTSLNIHRLFITSIMLSAKFFDDHYYNNAFYARIGGVAVQELNQLELEFLFMVGFSLAVTADEYSLYYKELMAHSTVLKATQEQQQFQQQQLLLQQQQQQKLLQQQQQQQQVVQAIVYTTVAPVLIPNTQNVRRGSTQMDWVVNTNQPTTGVAEACPCCSAPTSSSSSGASSNASSAASSPTNSTTNSKAFGSCTPSAQQIESSVTNYFNSVMIK